MKSDYEFAYVVVKYRSGIHRVQRMRSPYNGDICNRIPRGNGVVATCRKRFIGEAYLNFEDAWNKMIKLHEEHKKNVYWRLKITKYEYENLQMYSKELDRASKLYGFGSKE